jgi:hypothetical protein
MPISRGIGGLAAPFGPSDGPSEPSSETPRSAARGAPGAARFRNIAGRSTLAAHMVQRVAWLAGVLVLMAADSRPSDASDRPGDDRAQLSSATDAAQRRAPPQPEALGDDADDRDGSPTADMDRAVFDAIRRDRPADLAARSAAPLGRQRFDAVRSNLLASRVKFDHSVPTAAGVEVVYKVVRASHDLHLVYERHGSMKLVDAWVFGW